MVSTGLSRDLIIGVTPFETPNPQLAIALLRGGALGVLDLGRDSARARTALAQMSRWAKEPWAVRVPAGCPLAPHEIPAGATTILLPIESPWNPLQLAGRRVLIEVTDRGPGVPIALRERIFEPFYTTKPAGVGTGLGLSVSKAIVQRHGGVLELRERGGRPAFVIDIPADSGQPGKRARYDKRARP